MADTEQTLDRRLVVCPLSMALGYLQNYRVTERPNRGVLESRPVKDTDAFAEDFFKVLHGEKGELITVRHSSGKEIQLRGLGQASDVSALKFSMLSGLKARENGVKLVNTGQIRAPKKNWDKTYGPEKMYTYTDPKSGEEHTFQLGGGKSVDTLKQEFPELYGTKSSRRSNSDNDEGMIDDDALDALETMPMDASSINQPISRTDEELDSLADEIQGEGAYSDDQEVDMDDAETIANEVDESYAAVAVAEETDMVSDEFDIDFEDNTESGESAAQASHEGRLSGAAKARHDLKEETGSGRIQEFDDPRTIKESKKGTGHSIGHSQALGIRQPTSSTAIKSNSIKFMDGDEEHAAYKIRCPNCEMVNWFENGHNHCRSCSQEVELTVHSS